MRPPLPSRRRCCRAGAGRAAIALAVLLAAAPLRAQSAPGSGALELAITGAESTQGVLLVALYDRPESWLKTARALRVLRVAPAARVVVRLDGLPPGTYAVGVIHDVNQNDKLDFAFWPYPHLEEAAGMSNNPTSRIGPPSFAASAFVLGAGTQRLEIALQR